MKYIFIVFMLCTGVLWGQDSMYFSSPVKHKIKLSGSFGELRSNHFHAGIDIKSTKGVDGDTIYAAASGYISRVKVQNGGYGKALYIDHPNGHTTVYAHLSSFTDELNEYIKQRQLLSKSYEIDVYPEASKYNFEKGEAIGLMGNTGRSFGTHLHFEIRTTKEEVPQNPYLFDIGPEDTRDPIMYAASLSEFNASGEIVSTETISLKKGKSNKYYPKKKFTCSGEKVGMALQVFDRMNGASNLNGVYALKMYVGDSLYYEHKLDAVGFHETRYINSHIDYKEKQDFNRTMVRCFILPGNRLGIYKRGDNKGYIYLKEGETKEVKFEVLDYKGNVSLYHCSVTRSGTEELAQSTYMKKVDVGLTQTFKLYSTDFTFYDNSLDRDVYFNYKEEKVANGLNMIVGDESTPIFTPVKLEVDISHIDSALLKRIVLINSGKKPTSYGGEIKEKKLVAVIDRLGKYKIIADIEKPSIKAIRYSKKVSSRGTFIFNISDNYKTRGSAKDLKFDAYIDGEWIICPFNVIKESLYVPYEKLSKGVHTLRVKAEDHSGNVNDYISEFRVI